MWAINRAFSESSQRQNRRNFAILIGFAPMRFAKVEWTTRQPHSCNHLNTNARLSRYAQSGCITWQLWPALMRRLQTAICQQAGAFDVSPMYLHGASWCNFFTARWRLFNIIWFTLFWSTTTALTTSSVWTVQRAD
jgi:hypothetical protein